MFCFNNNSLFIASEFNGRCRRRKCFPIGMRVWVTDACYRFLLYQMLNIHSCAHKMSPRFSGERKFIAPSYVKNVQKWNPFVWNERILGFYIFSPVSFENVGISVIASCLSLILNEIQNFRLRSTTGLFVILRRLANKYLWKSDLNNKFIENKWDIVLLEHN